MELGLGSYAFRWALGHPALQVSQPLTLDGLVDETAQLGCSLLQVADNPELDALDSAARVRLRDHARSKGVRLQIGTSGLAADRLRHQLSIATDLEADVVRIVLDANGIHPSEDDSVAILQDIAPQFEAAGVTVAIENHFATPSSQIVSIIERVDSAAVGVCLDTANSIMIGEWPDRTINMLAPYCVNVHLKDYAVLPDGHGIGGHVVGRVLGEGWIDVESTIAAIRAADDRARGRLGVILEQWLPLEKDADSTLAAERAGREAAVAAARRLLRVPTNV